MQLCSVQVIPGSRCPGIVAFMLLAAAALHSSATETEPPAVSSPTTGSWKGFPPGTYRIEKHTFRSLSYRKDGDLYTRGVLWKATPAGGASLFSFTADTADGPWKPSQGWGSDEEWISPEAVVNRKELPEEDLNVGARVFHCRVTRTTLTDDYGTTVRQHWTDPSSGLDLKREQSFDGQYPDGRPWRWKLSRLTTGIETVTIGTNRISCFVQEQLQTVEGGEELRWHELVADSVPGHLVTSAYSGKKDGPPQVEASLVEWGSDPALIPAYEQWRREHGQDEELNAARRKTEDEERQRGVDELLRQTLADLKSPDAERRESAASCLGAWPMADARTNAVIQALKRALDDSSPKVRRQAAIGLGRRGAKGMTPRFVELLQRDPGGVANYIEALGLQADPEALPVILQQVSSTNVADRSAAVQALGNFKTEAARVALEEAVDDSAPGVRFRAVEALVRLGNPRSLPVFLRVLRDPDPLTIHKAVEAVAELGDDNELPALLELLDSPNELTRMAVCGGIATMNLEDAGPAGDALMKRLDDPSVMVRSLAAASLGALRERRAVPKLLALAETPDTSTNAWFDPRLAAIAALGRIGDPAAAPVLVQLLDARGSRHAACDALALLGEPAAEPLWQHYLRTPDKAVGRQELEALARAGTRDTVVAMQEYLTRCPPSEKRIIRETIRQIEERLAHR